MKNKLFKRLLLIVPVFLLSACGSISINFHILNNYENEKNNEESIGKINIQQVNSILFWDSPNSDATYTYKVYRNGELYLKTFDYMGLPLTSLTNGGINDTFKVEAYLDEKIVSYSDELKVASYQSIPGSDEADMVFQGYDQSNLEAIQGEISYKSTSGSYPFYNEYTFTITSGKDVILIRDFVRGHYRFEFLERTKPMYIYLKNTTILSQTGNNKPIFNYIGNNTDVNFFIFVEGENNLGGSLNEGLSQGTHIISLPNVVFGGGSGTLTVQGDQPNYASEENQLNAGYAVKTNKLFSICEKDKIVLIGGKGFAGDVSSSINGGSGQFPISPEVNLFSLFLNSLSIKSGDGGNGGENPYGKGGNGGNSFSYDYLIKNVYPNSSCMLKSFGEPRAGCGGAGANSQSAGNDGSVL